jgi:hypothetical protein
MSHSPFLMPYLQQQFFYKPYVFLSYHHTYANNPSPFILSYILYYLRLLN